MCVRKILLLNDKIFSVSGAIYKRSLRAKYTKIFITQLISTFTHFLWEGKIIRGSEIC